MSKNLSYVYKCIYIYIYIYIYLAFLNDLNIDVDTNADATDNGSFELQTSGIVNSFGTFEAGGNSASQYQFTEKNTAEKVRKVVDNAAIALRTRVLHAILTAMDNVVRPIAELNVRPMRPLLGWKPLRSRRTRVKHIS